MSKRNRINQKRIALVATLAFPWSLRSYSKTRALSDSHGAMTIELFIILVGILLVSIRLWTWLREGTPKPDPWDSEVAHAMEEENAEPLCYHCLAPLKETRWFCPECGSAVGPYNNYDPYLRVFSQGQLLRTGVLDPVRRSPLIIIGYIILPLAFFAIFAPVYWYFLFRNLNRPIIPAAEPLEPQI